MPPTKEQKRLAVDLKDGLLHAYDPEAVILFGSLGRGDADEFSDVDLFVVMETDRDVKELSEEMAGYLDSITKDKHIIVRTPRDFCRERDIPGTIVFSAVKDGQILFEKGDWQTRYLPVDSYRERKIEVIQREYVRSAHDFLTQAESSLRGSHFFRCRDFARFAAVRAIKGIFVKNDRHPPRELDLIDLLALAKEMEPDLMEDLETMRELNGYCPGKADAVERRRSRRMLDRTTRFVNKIIAGYVAHVEV